MIERLIRIWGNGPQKFSAFMGHFAEKRIPKWILKPVLKAYISYYHIDMNLFKRGVEEYMSFTDFFTRRLKDGVRTFEGLLISPAESILTDFGLVSSNMEVKVKGMGCKLALFLRKIVTINFKSFAIFYLSPADYHRFHAPFDMEIEKLIYIPGDLYSVKPKNVEKYNTLFCDNRKVVIYGSSDYGKFAMVLVGALVVGKIVLNFGKKRGTKLFEEEIVNLRFDKGDELGAFELGSTVILLTESDVLSVLTVEKGEHVLVGQDLYQFEAKLV